MQIKRGRVAVLGVLLALSFVGLTAAPAVAGTAEEIAVLPTVDPLNRNENPLSNGSKWSPLNWATTAGQDTTSGWIPASGFPTVNGAYWNPSTLQDQSGNAAALTMQTAPGISERYLSVWLNMPSPGSAKSGYQLRWTVNATTSTYTVKLSKWVSGTETVLASNASVTIPAGATLAIADTGGTVSAFMASGGGAFTSLLSAADSTYASGYAGIEGSGSNSRSTNFKAGSLMGGAIASAAVLDNFERSEVPLANGKWSKSTWTASIGGAWCCSTYRGFGSSSGLAGAYWNQATFSDASGGVLVAATVGTGSASAGQYQALWLNAPNPGSAQSGYEARFTGVNGLASNYKLELSKWVAGTRTVLASKEGVSLAVGTTMALTEAGGGLVVWTGTGSNFTPLVSAADSTYSGGYAGIDVNGGAGTAYNFKAGAILQPPDTSISSNSSNGTVPPNVAFSFSSPSPGATFECSLDGGVYGACTSPKAYEGLEEGNHVFRVRAVNSVGADSTPAERSVQSFTAAQSIAKAPLLDDFNREEFPLATAPWGKASWVTEIGMVRAGTYKGYGPGNNLSGAYWKPTTFNDSQGAVLTTATLSNGPIGAEEYLSLWLNSPSPTTQKSGYEARFTGTNGSTSGYKAELSRWVSGVKTQLAAKENVSMPMGTTVALGETGGHLTVWSGKSGAYTPLLAGYNSTYASGYAGIEMIGGARTAHSFKAGNMDLVPPDTTIASGPTGTVLLEQAVFNFTSTEANSSFECSVDGGAYSSCPNPKSFSVLATGPHTLKVRAVDLGGNQDPTPVERSFSIVQPPSVTASAATAIKANQATLTASINPNLSAATFQFEYGTTTSYGSKVPASAKSIGSGGAVVEASEPITGLVAGTTYNFRVSATNAWGTTKSANKTFTTTATPAISLTTANELKADQATLFALLNPRGAATTYQFEYGPTITYGTKVPATPKSAGSGSSAVVATEAISGLSENSTYHFRLVATNEVGTTYGPDTTLTTPRLADVDTEASEAVNANEAILVGEVDPNGLPTSYTFEYGSTTSYGAESAVGLSEAGSGEQAVKISEPIAGLKPQTTYHYRVKATGSAGTVLGQDLAFTTTASSLSPAEELKAEEEEEAGASSAPPPGDWAGMMTSGNLARMATKSRMISLKESGAKWLRLQMHGSLNQQDIQWIFNETAKRGIRILPYFETGGAPSVGTMDGYIKESIQKYGPHGTFWQGKGYAMPATWWEIGNEPNRGDTVGPNSAPIPDQFGRFFAHAAATARTQDDDVRILFAGLYSAAETQMNDCGGGVCKMKIREFLNGADQGIAEAQKNLTKSGGYNAVSVHPYLKKVNKHEIRKENINAVKKALRGFVREGYVGGANKPVWITEFGFPTSYDGTGAHLADAPPVSEALQGELIEAAFQLFKGIRQRFDVAHAFYYNIEDRYEPVKENRVWPWACGLRTSSGKVKRPGWRAYALATGGNPNWPKPAKVNKKGPRDIRGRAGTFAAGLENDGSGTFMRFQYWKPGSNPTVVETPFMTLDGDEAELDVEYRVTSLQPETEYVYHGVATNEEDDTTVGENYTFKTPPSTSTSLNVRRTLHGSTGYLWVEGWAKEGQIDGSLPGLSNVHIHINLYRDGQQNPERFVDVMTNGEGYYSSGYFPIGNYAWDVTGEFPGGAELDKSESGRKDVYVHDGVLIKAKHSEKCMDVEGGWFANSVRIMHGECHGKANQVFGMRPKGDGSTFEIIARHSGKCVDVGWASGADGEQIIQHDCNGGSNQAFRESEPWEGNYTTLRAVHSGKCLDVENGTQGWGPIKQYTCNSNPQQRFTYEPVNSGPIPTEVYVTPSHIIHGNGQYGNWGLATVSGNLFAGPYSMENRMVHIQVQKINGSGQWAYHDDLALPVNAEGKYRFNDYGMGPGIFRLRAMFSGSSDFDYSESGWHQFSIWQANRIVARHSNRCLTLSENKNVNGQHLIQWDCVGSGSFGDGQTFWIWPVGNNVYEITVISTGKCIDLANAYPGNGSFLQQWDCNHFGQQRWQMLPIDGQPGWYALRPQHTGNQCLDVKGAGTGNGAEVWEWECHWGGNQQWRIDGVIAG